MTGTATAATPDHRPPGTAPATDGLADLAALWGGHPGTVRAAAPLDGVEAHALAVRCSEPFRAGTQAHAVTRVRFHTTAGRVVAPGGLLPETADGGTDGALAGYLARVSRRLPDQGWLYTVDQALPHDAGAWLRTRDLLAGLWDRVGQPAAPVSHSIAVGDGYQRPAALGASAGAAVLLWVLHGTCAVRLRPASAADGHAERELVGHAGDLLHWPAGYHSTERFPGRGAVLRITVPQAPGEVRRVVRDEVRELAGAATRTAPEEPPGLPSEADDRCQPTAPVPALGDIAGELHDRLRSEEFDAALRLRWALRRSTAGLEPAPDPAPDSALDAASTVRVTGRIVPATGSGPTVWAVNGHPLPLGGGSAAAVSARLTEGRECTVAALCRDLGAPPGHPQVVDLLRTLHRLRAVRVAPDPPAAPPHAAASEDSRP